MSAMMSLLAMRVVDECWLDGSAGEVFKYYMIIRSVVG